MSTNYSPQKIHHDVELPPLKLLLSLRVSLIVCLIFTFFVRLPSLLENQSLDCNTVALIGQAIAYLSISN